MAKLPYTYTICPPGPEPKQYTASCKQMGELLMNSIKGDLTINNRLWWDSWTNAPVQAKPLEDRLHELAQSLKKDEGKK